MSFTTLEKITEDLFENYGSDKSLNGALVILWEEDNGISVSYLGTPLTPLACIELGLNGTRVMVQSAGNVNQEAEPKSQDTVRLVDE